MEACGMVRPLGIGLDRDDQPGSLELGIECGNRPLAPGHRDHRIERLARFRVLPAFRFHALFHSRAAQTSEAGLTRLLRPSQRSVRLARRSIGSLVKKTKRRAV